MGIDINDYDIDAIRNYLEDYFGTAIASFPLAMADLIDLSNKSDYEIISIAINLGVNINNYLNNKRY